MILELNIKPKNFNIIRIFLTALFVISIIILNTPKVLANSSSLVINQVQTGSSASATQEYISLFNNSNTDIDITDWCVVYSSSSDVTQTNLGCFISPDAKTRLFAEKLKTITLASVEFSEANNNYQSDLVFKSGISGTSGHIKILDSSKNIIDKLGWGSAVNPETKPITSPASGKSAKRSFLDSTLLKDTDNNFTDFISTELVIIQGGNIIEETPEPVIDNSPMIQITELLPNPGGSDLGNEYIEIFNPNVFSVNLTGYKLVLGPDYEKSFTLGNVTLAQESYISFTDVQSGLTLPNTSATVRLVSPNGTLLSESVEYKDAIEAVSWNYYLGNWQNSYLNSPGSMNIIVAEKPCPEGQYRSEETGYCRNMSSSEPDTTLCPTGQTRNEDTNRCRKITEPSKAASCKPGQIRNLETGRCRNIVIATSKECPEGQTRNEVTKRCRKVTSISPDSKKLAEVKDISTPLVKNNMKWWFAGSTAAGSVGYAGFEWRRELRNLLAIFRKS